MTYGIAAYIAVAAAATCIGCIVHYLADREFRAGRLAYMEDKPLNASWLQAKRDGWSTAWGEHLRASLGSRGQ